MLNEMNDVQLYKMPMIQPLTSTIIANNASSQCKRSVGAGYYDANSDKTILCHSGEGMNIYLTEYDHQKKTYDPSYCVFENNMYNRWDYHNYANLVKAPDGEKVIFFTKHTKEMYMIKSPDWEKVRISDDFTCYPSPVVAGDDIYVFYSRHDNEVNGNVVEGVRMHAYRTLWFIKSSDNGETWDAPVKVIDTQKQSSLEIDEVYLCGCNYYPAYEQHPDRIQLAWTMWGGVNGHASSNEAAYCCYLSLADRQIYSPDGKLIGDWADYRNMIEHCSVYRTKEYDSKAMKVASVLSTCLSNGNIMVIYGVLSDHGIASVRSAELIEGRWEEMMVTEETYSVKDVYRDEASGDVKIVYAKGDCLVIDEYDELNKYWKTKHTSRLKFNNGSNSIQYANFILDHKSEVQVVTGQSGPEIEDLYTGIWPICSFGI